MKRVPVWGVMLIRDSSIAVEKKEASTPSTAAEIIRAFIKGTDREHMVALLLDARQKVIGINEISVGTLTASLVHPRETFKPAILAGAAGIIVAHNHPSGESSPSQEDKTCTQRLVRAGEILGIPVVDHIIITDGGHFSFLENGLL